MVGPSLRGSVYDSIPNIEKIIIEKVQFECVLIYQCLCAKSSGASLTIDQGHALLLARLCHGLCNTQNRGSHLRVYFLFADLLLFMMYCGAVWLGSHWSRASCQTLPPPALLMHPTTVQDALKTATTRMRRPACAEPGPTSDPSLASHSLKGIASSLTFLGVEG